MIPDGFQYLLHDFWNFQHVHQFWARTPRTKMLQKKEENYGNIIKNIFFIFHHFGNPEFPNVLTLTDIRNVELCVLVFCCFSKYCGSKTIGFSERFQRIVRWWNLDKFWKSEKSHKS